VAGGVFGGGERCGPADGFVVARTLAGRGLVMAGGSDEVAVARVDVEVVQTPESGESVRAGQFPTEPREIEITEVGLEEFGSDD
jgi:hypothetical protein